LGRPEKIPSKNILIERSEGGGPQHPTSSEGLGLLSVGSPSIVKGHFQMGTKGSRGGGESTWEAVK